MLGKPLALIKEIRSIRLLGHRLGTDLGQSSQLDNGFLRDEIWVIEKSANLGQALIKAALARRGISISAFARILGKSSGNITSIINGTLVNRQGTRARPPLDEMPRWAAVLGLDPAETSALIEWAELAHCPPGIQQRYLAMRDALNRLSAGVADGEDPDQATQKPWSDLNPFVSVTPDSQTPPPHRHGSRHKPRPSR